MTYLTPPMRFMLLFISIAALIFVIGYIRKSRVQIEDTIFWVVISVVLVIFAVVPAIVYVIAWVLQIESPANFVFLLLISILLVNQFYLTMKVSGLQIKLREVTQRIALDSARINDKKDERENAERKGDGENL